MRSGTLAVFKAMTISVTFAATLLGMFLAPLTYVGAALAEDIPVADHDTSKQLLWSDSKGLISVEGCQLGTANDIAENFDLNVDERPKRTRSLHKASADKKNSRGFTDLADYVIEIRQNLKLASGDQIAFPPSGLPLRGSFWQVAVSDDKALTALCGKPEQTYLLFDVFVPHQIEPLARVGVNANEISLFKVVEVHTPKEAERAIVRANGSNPVFIKAPTTSPATIQPTTQPSPKPTSPNTNANVTGSGSGDKPAVKPDGTNTPKNDGEDLKSAFTPSSGNATQPDAAANPVEVVSGGLSQVVCTTAGTIEVLASDLVTRLFVAGPLENVRPVQSFGVDKKSKVRNGRNVTFVKVQFPKRKENANLGWIDSTLVKAQSKCALAGADRKGSDSPPPPQRISGEWGQFPLLSRPTQSYHEGMRRFRAGRSKGRRLHAACDLYRPEGERVVAVSSGEVIRSRYYFYTGVYALEVRHDNGYVVRYGEVLAKAPAGTSSGDRIKAGQTLGYVGWIGNPNISPMLHFELYSGNVKGALTQLKRAGFQRRSDLLDPTNHLIKWEQAKFGKHW